MWLSTAMSPQERLVAGLNLAADSGRSSPSRKKLKNAVQATTHTMHFSGLLDAIRLSPMLARMGAVMGSLLQREGLGCLDLATPAWTLFRMGIGDWGLGSPA